MKRFSVKLYKYIYVLVCMAALLAGGMLQATAEAAEHKVVRVGWYEDVYNNITRNGERSGFCYDYEQSIAGYTGWTYEYVHGGWEELLEKLGKGEIDLIGSVSYTDARAQKMLFSDEPMGMEKYYLYAKIGTKGISAADLSTMNGKRVGLLYGSVQGKMFDEWKAKHNLQIENVYAKGFDDTRELLRNNELDGFVTIETPYWEQYGMFSVATISTSGIYFAINKERPDLKQELDAAMRKLDYDRPFYANDLYKRYYPEASSAVLSAEEKAWLKQHGSIRIGYLENDGAFSRVDPDTGKVVGVINDYVNFAGDCLGKDALHFELVGFAGQKAMTQALKDNKIDMLFHFSENPFVAEQNSLLLSNNALTGSLLVCTAQDFFNENAENVVAIKKSDYILQRQFAYHYPQWKFVEYDSLEDMAKAVRNNQVACMAANPMELAQFSDDGGLHSVLLTKTAKSVFAVGRENTVLLSILNKTLKKMPPSMLTGAWAMYNSAPKKVTVVDFIRAHMLLAVLVLLVVATILVLLMHARMSEAKAKELNRRLEEAVESARQADMAKTNFLFNMSHDIRTPMNALLGYSQLIKEGLTEPKLLDYQQKMEQSGNLLLMIINNVLDMARIESGKMELDENYVNAEHFFDEIKSVFEVEAEKKNISFVFDINIRQKHLMCDSTKIKEVFSNLIGNALKYTLQGGRVEVHSNELPCSREGYTRVRTDFIDNGIGMSKEYLPKLFDSFSRERNTTSSKVAGTGLGMAIVKHLVDLLGGTIEVESALGKGTKFSVTFEHRLADPAYYEKTKQKKLAKKDKQALKGKHILLAEDNDLNAEIALYILRGMGLVVERVEDGVQCVSRMEQQPAGAYDLIFMDVQMPHMDGYKATLAIRRFADKQKASIPIVAMTANAFEEDKKNAFDAGMNGHIAKPIDVAKVEQTLLELLK